MAEISDYATRRAVMDCRAIGDPLPPVSVAVQDELDGAATGLQVALDYCRGNAAQRQRVARALGRLRIAATLSPELQPQLRPLIEQLDAALECIGWIDCSTVQSVQDGVLDLLAETKR